MGGDHQQISAKVTTGVSHAKSRSKTQVQIAYMLHANSVNSELVCEIEVEFFGQYPFFQMVRIYMQ